MQTFFQTVRDLEVLLGFFKRRLIELSSFYHSINYSFAEKGLSIAC